MSSKKTKKDFNIKDTIRDIQVYLRDYIEIRNLKKMMNKNKRYRQKNDNISCEATEDMAKLLIQQRQLLPDRYGDTPLVESTGRNNKQKSNDLYINGKHKIEVKATTSEDLFTTVSKNNLDCDLWIWLDFSKVVEGVCDYVEIHIIKNPGQNIKPWKIETNNELKITLDSIKKNMSNYNDYSFAELDVWKMKIKKPTDSYNKFF